MSSIATKLTAAMEALKIEVETLQRENDRLQNIKDTIRVNAQIYGANDEQIERLLDGRDNVIDWMVEAIRQKQTVKQVGQS